MQVNALPLSGTDSPPPLLSGTDRATALPEDLELRGFPPLEAALALRVCPPPGGHTDATAARRLRLARIRAFAMWAAQGGIPNAIYFHPEVGGGLFSTSGVPPAPPGSVEEKAGGAGGIVPPAPDHLPPPPASLAPSGAGPPTAAAAAGAIADPLDTLHIRGLLVGVDLSAAPNKGHNVSNSSNNRGRGRESRKQHAFPTPSLPGFEAKSTDTLKELQASLPFVDLSLY